MISSRMQLASTRFWHTIHVAVAKDPDNSITKQQNKTLKCRHQLTYSNHPPCNGDLIRKLLLLSGELLTERCRTDDLMPSIPVLCLPPSRVDPKVLGLNVLIYHSQPGGSWMTRRSPPIRWWSQHGGYDTVVVLLWSWSSQVPKKPDKKVEVH